MELKDTVVMMQSDDYKERLKAEYWQTQIRYDVLHETILKYMAGTLEFEPVASLELYKTQAEAMKRYLTTLKARAELENIEL